MTKPNTKEWEIEFEEAFVADGILDCIPEKNWAEMNDNVYRFICNLLEESRQEFAEELLKKLPKEKEFLEDDEGFERCVDKTFSLERGRGWNLYHQEIKNLLK